jgi:Tfp pilus assembly protein PilP
MKGLSGKLWGVAIAGCLVLSNQILCFTSGLGLAAEQGGPAVTEEAVKTPESSEASEMTAPQAPAAIGSVRDSAPSEASVKVQQELLQSQFAYNPKILPDPFKPFIAPADAPPTVAAVGDEDLDLLPPEPQRPVTPLQKMRLSEVEAGLKAIMWGPLGRRAVIEDASGKGYIVSVGTPVGEGNGVVTEIFNDHLVIQQEYWDKQDRRMVPQNVMVKLKKTTK